MNIDLRDDPRLMVADHPHCCKECGKIQEPDWFNEETGMCPDCEDN